MFGLSPIVQNIIIGFVAIVVIWLAYSFHINGIREEERHKTLLEFNRQQQAQIEKDREEFKNLLNSLRQAQAEAVLNLRMQQEKIDERFNNIDTFLSSDAAIRQNQNASPLLRDVFRQLGAPN